METAPREKATRFGHMSARVGEFRRRIVRHVQCRACGYEPRGATPCGRPPASCPKCGGGCWERFAQVGKLRPDPPAARPARLRRAAPAPASTPPND